MNHKAQTETEPQLPLKLEPVSNGEYIPRPMSGAVAEVCRRAHARAAEIARWRGVSRRELLQSSAGIAVVLAAMNSVLGCSGGRYRVRASDETDEDAARESLGQGEFIFDAQTHRVSADRDWYEQNDVFRKLASGRGACGDSWLDCYTSDHFIREVFLDSDTHAAVLSAVPGGHDKLPLTAREAAETRETVDRTAGSHRLLIHGILQPKVHPMEEVLEHAHELKETWNVAGFKLYPVWGPDGTGWWLDDEQTGMRLLEKAQSLGVRNIAVHKGLPQPGMDPEYSRPRDIGPVAKAFPDLNFLVYHSGFEHDHTEGPYDPTKKRGVDALISSAQEHGIGAGGNVYPEMGVLWRELRSRPKEAAHTLGKLMKHFGEDRLLWGTDSIWFGSPQDQIESFRAFEIDEQFQEEFGYPALTAQRKAKIFGQNGAAVYGVDVEELTSQRAHSELDRARAQYRQSPQPSFRTYGPRTRRQVLGMTERELLKQ